MEIRKIQRKDNGKMRQIIKGLLEEHNLDIPGTAYFDESLKSLSRHYRGKGQNYFVIEEEGQVIGGGGYGPFSYYKDVAELQKLYIQKDYQGQGLASPLYQAIEESAREEGYKDMYIETSTRLSKANQIYRTWGFEPMAEPLTGSTHPAMDRYFIKSLEK